MRIFKKNPCLVTLPNRGAVPRHIIKVTACAVLLVAGLPDAARAAEQVSAVRLAHAQGHTRIVLESHSLVRFVLFSLRNPERAVLTLEGVELNAVLAGLVDKVGADHPFIKSIRVRQSGAHRARVELDFKTEIEPHIFTLKPEGRYRYRIVLDLYTPQAAQRVAAETFGDEAARIAAEANAGDEVLLAVRINGLEPAETVLLLRRDDGRLLARREDLERWRLRVPDAALVNHSGEVFVPLDALRGLSYRVDETTQTLDLNAGPGLFGMTQITGSPAGFVTPTLSSPGGFFNYDFFVDHGQGRNTTNGLFELGAFGGWGAGTSTFVHRDQGGNAPFVRLETTWRRDRPAALATLQMGDAISGAGGWGRSIRFGGVQWKSNFAVQPGFTSIPLPGLAGEAVLPSTVDLYVNEALRMRREVPVGPFSIQNLPIVTGQGEARLVVRDILGREQVITQPYYASPRLLQQGLHDYSYELGFVRENYGFASNDYGRFIAVGTHRVGMTDRFTGEVRGELLRGQQTVGLSGAFLWPAIGVLSASLAASHSDAGTGGLLGLGIERQSSWLSFGATTQLAGERFVQVGLQPGEYLPRQLSRVVFASISTKGYGSFGMTYTHQDRRNQEDVRLITASYSVGLGKLGFLGLSFLRSLGDQATSTVGLVFTRSFGERTSASAAAAWPPGGSSQSQFQLQRSLPAGTGMGYRLRAGAGDSEVREAAISAQNGIGTYSLEASQLGGQTGVRGSASGGIALIGSKAFLGRRMSDSFAVVQVPDYPNVRVYADNQLVARTRADGSALVPRLRAYEKNSIRIEQADLPLDAQIDALQLESVPYFRSGLGLQFPVKRSRGALLALVLDNGKPMPAGAVAQVGDGTEEFPVGERGELYLTGLMTMNRIRVTWRGKSCQLSIPFPKTADPLPHLGTYKCTGVKP